ncbi:hypothetical protein NXX39_29140, partial [Bacteroides ovatus]|nr:hypothetical protein [Bacteroides ovatus]
EKERQPPEGVPRHSAAGKGIPNLSGRDGFSFQNENGKLCAAALRSNFVPHHPCPFDVASPSGVGGCSGGAP